MSALLENSSTAAVVIGLYWRPIDSAPKDGTLLLLLVDADTDGEDSSMPTEDALTYRTIGHNNLDHDGEDQWQFAGWCWSHDHYVEGRGAPTHWMPMPTPLTDTTLNTPPGERGAGTRRTSGETACSSITCRRQDGIICDDEGCDIERGIIVCHCEQPHHLPAWRCPVHGDVVVPMD